ncbi:H-2 class I histocompatibility antigen, alpha chain-like [Puntigrus tetrazona]|uniref:H-2 class I histocompatibility antigen, alpha chain-like n=1 Tax=Puntigrus tetrazona TaxID=1606681 RepID=UPI001C8A39AD|nr:H-2 class I histocompatibility antigen, alpha chain-like [Puntigrus tetrazona]
MLSIKVLLFYCAILPLQSERHHFFYRFTVLSKAESFSLNLPDFTAEAVADDRRIKHYNNAIEGWKGVDLFEHDGSEPPPESYDSRDWYRDQLKKASNSSQGSERHVLQRILGCKLESFPNGTVTDLTTFDEYAFDGDDLIAFKYDTMEWIDKSPVGKEIKKDWDRHVERKHKVHSFLYNCMDWISAFNNTNKSSPEVHIFARKAPDDRSKLDLICLATGFYPGDIEMSIRLNRSTIKNHTSYAIRPNHDGSFQVRSSVKIDGHLRGSYDCFVVHGGLGEPRSVQWDGKCLNSERTRWTVILPVGAFLVAAVVYIKKRKPNDSSAALVRDVCVYGAVSDQRAESAEACADTTDEELSDEGSEHTPV